MKRFVAAFVIFCAGMIVGGIVSERDSVLASIPKTPPRINVQFIVMPCPKEWDGTPLCDWWRDYQKSEESRWRQLLDVINRGFSLTFEGVRGTP